MKRGILTVPAAMTIALMWAAAASAGGWSLGGFGGMGLPTGDFASAGLTQAGLGYQFGFDVRYHLDGVWALGVDLGYVKNPHGAEGTSIDLGGGDRYTLDSDKFTTVQFGVHARATLPGSGPLRYHGLLGIGSYRTKEEYEETYLLSGVPTTLTGETEAQSGFGIRFGAGALYALNAMWGVGVDVDYHLVAEDEEEDLGISSLQYLGVKGVVRFTIP